ncbi:SDR family oxidoreductase [Streptomyces poriferorum]|uniref:SDR family oxidoreductase n=2 Tax=Streptomyces poriferorum TaxID=2798799 RepID=A0ABY9IXX8_9ACTN|nr:MULTISPECIES: SDR family oxidoreductase [Streptomyces]MBW5262775.1 SDR family oxidoreductase [Streptomyces poriferorum]MDP5311304.1 SDR family oxidoreductase [Streptomyces sp. Alt4]WLQ47723.1 SDR family oxidoreductase [Streptomyces sp. Alt1]WLQ59589.1 SDR family oxidoreductase [Streptomyces sp. Alt2]
MDLRLKGHRILVTGGSSGVGLATIRMLLEEGARVATCGRRADALAKALDGLAGPDALYHAPCDVRDEAAVQAFTEAAADHLGGLDGLVNNAGASRMKPFADTTNDDWRDELELKFFGVLNPLNAALPHLRASGHASVVNINAVLAKQPETALMTTSAARAGILNLSTSLSRELAPDGIRVNSVCLGLVDTGQWERRYAASGSPLDYTAWQTALAADRGIALGRLGNADEVAYAVTALLSPRASYITGTTVDVCGGVNRAVA